ncbi:SIMPL domain-containing protein [Actinoplanes sp. NPDC020271]|uniref:SIMPL domain-containing protein n=1 Tax=Actinoplanes sp. NPDC020271 TaxID=3363896 RepID=UPI0037AB4980
MAEAIVVATGDAVREVQPEQAVVSVRSESKGRSRESVLERLTQRSAAIGVVLDQFDAAIERRESAGLHIRPQMKRRGEEVLAYHGSIGIDVIVTDFTVLGDLMLKLGAEELTSVHGPWWRMRADSRAGAGVRQAAVADALAKAAEYAAAVGARIERLVEITDSLSDGGFRAGAGGAMMRSKGATGETQALELELEPELQLVQATVKVTVTISEPTLPI